VAVVGDAAAMRQRKANDNAVDRCRIAGAMSDIIHRSASSSEPGFALESCRVVDAGRLPTVVASILPLGQYMCIGRAAKC